MSMALEDLEPSQPESAVRVPRSSDWFFGGISEMVRMALKVPSAEDQIWSGWEQMRLSALKNCGWEGILGPGVSGWPVSVMVLPERRAENCQPLAGTGWSERALVKRSACGPCEEAGATGMVRERSQKPGEQERKQHIHEALVLRVTSVARMFFGGVMSTMRSVSDSKPWVLMAAILTFSGAGHWMGPALKPLGRDHWRLVATPARPGFFQ